MATPGLTPTTGAAGAVCPKCGAAQPAGSKFCNACGAALGAPPAVPSASAPPVDIRQTVEGDRGVLKRLQLLIPGFRGYREGEDIRAADSLLRRQVADKVMNARLTIENSRSALTNSGQFQTLNDLAPIIADLMRIEGEVRHAEQGYTGISPAVRANPPQLDRLYEYDYGFAVAADQFNAALAPLPALAANAAQGTGQLPALITTLRGMLAQLDTAFKARLQAVEGIRVA